MIFQSENDTDILYFYLPMKKKLVIFAEKSEWFRREIKKNSYATKYLEITYSHYGKNTPAAIMSSFQDAVFKL